jgi:hypothetical protein
MSDTTAILSGSHMASDEPVRNRIIIAVDGLDKHGKTRFALSAPKPLVYLDFDIGKEGVLQKAPGQDLIVTAKPFLFRPSEVTWGIEDDKLKEEKIMAAAERELTRFREVYLKSLTQPVVRYNGHALKARTVVVDTGSEAWELLRLCELGKLSQVKPHHYTQVNGLMRDLVRAAFDSDVNVIWLHKLKAEWKETANGMARKSGTLERAGFEGMSYLVQANLLATRIPANLVTATTLKWKSGEGLVEIPMEPRDEGDMGFRLVVGNSRHDPTLEGATLVNDGIDFPTIASMMMPEADPEAWFDHRPDA